MSLKKAALRGFIWDLTGTFARHGIKFVISIFLARLLEPEEFGLVGMALVFIVISQAFADFGFGSALIQNKKNTSVVYSSVFFINIIAGALICALFYGLAPFIADFFNNQALTSLIQWLSLSFVFSSFIIVQKSILTREINFKTINLADVISQTVSGIIAVILAFSGWGVYALVVQSLLGAFLNGVLLWVWTDWYPKIEFSWKEVKKLTGFSTFMFMDQILSRISNQLDVFFVGKVFSPATLGYYTRAQSLNNMVTQYTSTSFTKIFFPVLSKFQDDEEGFKRVYFRIISIICFFAFLVSGLMVFWGETIIVVLFGEKWQPSVIIFQTLILMAFARPINSMMVNAFLGKGKAKENFYVGLFRKIVRLFPLLVGFYYGLMPFIYALVACSYFLTFCNMLFMKRILKIELNRHLKKVFEGVIVFFPFIFLFFNVTLFENKILNNITYSVIFVTVYLLWSIILQNEGMLYVKSHIKPAFAKIKRKL